MGDHVVEKPPRGCSVDTAPGCRPVQADGEDAVGDPRRTALSFAVADGDERRSGDPRPRGDGAQTETLSGEPSQVFPRLAGVDVGGVAPLVWSPLRPVACALVVAVGLGARRAAAPAPGAGSDTEDVRGACPVRTCSRLVHRCGHARAGDAHRRCAHSVPRTDDAYRRRAPTTRNRLRRTSPLRRRVRRRAPTRGSGPARTRGTSSPGAGETSPAAACRADRRDRGRSAKRAPGRG